MAKSIKILMILTIAFLISSCSEKSYIYFNYNCDGKEYHECELKNNKINCEIVTPTCYDYTFKGWYKANEYDNPVDLNSEFKNKEVLFARWYYDNGSSSKTNSDSHEDINAPQNENEIKYTLSFNANGGNNIRHTSINDIKYGDSLPILDEIPTKEGYTFYGWYDSISGGNQYYSSSNEAVRNYDKEDNITLYAHWRINVLLIEYNGNTGVWNNTSNSTYGVNESGSVILKSTNEVYQLQVAYNKSLKETGLTDCNGIWFNWVKDGYKIETGREYIIQNGTTRTEIDQNKSYSAKELARYGGCDLTKNNCTITVEVNWINIESNINQVDEINKVDESKETEKSINTKSIDKIDITNGCVGKYENGDGIAFLKVNAIKTSDIKYEFRLDNKVVQSSGSPSYRAKDKYTLLINPEVVITEKNGNKRTITCNVEHEAFPSYNANGYLFAKKSSSDKSKAISNPALNNMLEYYLYIPKSAENTIKEMPLIIGFHGGESSGKAGRSPIHGLLGSNAKKPEAIIIAPTNVAKSKNWENGIYSARDIVYSIVKRYNIDLNRIVVNGGSQGGYATFLYGFLEEQVIYYADNDISLETVANQYGTTAEQVKEYNMKLNRSEKVTTSGMYGIKFKNKKKEILKKGTMTILRAKNSNDQRSMVSILIPNSPASNLSRCAFSSSNVTKSTNSPCPSVPAYTIKTPIWLIVSEEEGYAAIKNFAASITEYYEKNGNDIRYTVLQNIKNVKHGGGKLYDPHDTQHFIAAETTIFDWAIKQKAGEITVKNNEGIRQIEKKLNCVIDTGNTCVDTFKGVWTTIGQT